MQDKSHTFTIDIKGLPLTEEQQATISQALNDTLMHQIGKLDFRSKAEDVQMEALGGKSYGYIIDIRGGRWEAITRRSDFFRNVLQQPQIDQSINVGVQQFGM